MIRIALSLVIASVLICACGGAGPAPTSSAPSPTNVTTTYDVTYAAGTQVVDASAYDAALIAVDEAGAIYRFRPADWVSALKPGQVAIFSGHALVRISGVTQSGGETVVTTEPVALNEAISNGRVAWTYPVDWSSLPPESYGAVARDLSAMVTRPLALVGGARLSEGRGLAQAGPGLNWSGSIQGFDIEFGLTPTPDRLNLSLKAKRKLPLGTVMSATATGWISNFTQETFLTYEQSEGSQLSSKTIGLHGELQVEWHAAKLGEALTEITSFKIPVSLPIPFTVGPIPVVLKLMASLQVVPELSVDQASSGGSYQVTFSSDQGLEITGSSQTPFSDVKSVEIGVAGETVSAGFGPVAFALGIEFPRFEISVFGTTSAFITLKSYSSSQWTPGTTLTNDIPACQFGTSSLAAYAGYKAELLGFTLVESEPKELWKRDFTKYLNDKPCTLTGEPPP